MTSNVSNTRLKVGIALSVGGLILQAIFEFNKSVQDLENSGALLTCITYGTIGNDCQEQYAVTTNPFGWFLFYVGLCIISGHISGKIASNKGRDYANYFWLGFLLGVIGIIIVALMGDKNVSAPRDFSEDSVDDQKKCKYCAELIKKDAIFCKHCKNNLN
jgi:hypothetical protein